MHEVIICEKPSSAEKIAKALSPGAKKKVYNKKVKYWELTRDSKDITVVSGVGHLYSLIPKQQRYQVSLTSIGFLPTRQVKAAPLQETISMPSKNLVKMPIHTFMHAITMLKEP